MNPKISYRVAAVLLVLFAAGHQLGFRSTPPAWHADAVVSAMRTSLFTVNGLSRSYWGFFSAFGFIATVFLLFSAVLAWWLGGLTGETRRATRVVAWGLAACLAAVTVLTWLYVFVVPGVFAAVVTLFLVIGAAASERA